MTEFTDLRTCVVRIKDQGSGKITGTGFVIAPEWAVTCAHVVIALGSGPGDLVHLSFLTGGETLASVSSDGWDLDQDVAFLELRDPLPESVVPATLGSSTRSYGHGFRALGHPRLEPYKAIWATGEIQGPVEEVSGKRTMLQVSTPEIDKGMSGAPLLDIETNYVVGMVDSTYYPDKTPKFRDTNFATPTEVVAGLCPATIVLQKPEEREVDRSVTVSFNLFGKSSLLTECTGQLKAFEQHYLERNYFGGRQDELAELDDWLRQSERRNALLSAPAGLGKSALVARWVARLRQTTNLDVVYHPISLRFETHRRDVVLRSLVSQLVSVYSEDFPRVWDVSSLQSKFNNLLINPPELKRPLVVLVDGLDELDTMPAESIGLPVPAAGIHLLATARATGFARDKDITHWRQVLNWGTAPFEYMELKPLTRSAIEEIVKQTELEIGEGHLRPLVSKLHHLSNGHPLLVGLYLQRLQDSEDITVELFLGSDIEPGLEKYIERVEGWLEKDGAYDRDFLGLLSAAHGPLNLEDLENLGLQTPVDNLGSIARHSRGLIIGNGERSGFTLSHPLIGYAYAESHPLQMKHWENQFIVYGDSVYQKLKQGEIERNGVPSYVLEYYAVHLAKSTAEDSTDKLFDLVCEDWMQAHFEHSCSYDSFLGDVNIAWKKADDIGNRLLNSDAALEDDVSHIVDVQIRCALCFSTVASLSGQLPPSLPALLVRDREWRLGQAYAYINRMPDLVSRIWARLALLQTRGLDKTPFLERDRQEVLNLAIDELAQLTDKEAEELRGRLLLRVIPHLEEVGVHNQIEEIVRQAKSFRALEWRARLLGHLVRLMPNRASQESLLIDTLREYAEVSFSSSNEEAQALQPYILDTIAGNLPGNMIASALEAAFDRRHLSEERGLQRRAEENRLIEGKRKLLEGLAVHAPRSVAAEVFEACLEFDWHYPFLVRVTIALAPRLSYRGIKKALQYLAPLARSSGLNSTHTHDCAHNVLITSLIGLAHFCQDRTLKKEIGDQIESILDEIPDYDKQAKDGTTYRTLSTLYEIVFDECSDTEAARRVSEGDVKFTTYDSKGTLFCFLGPETMKAVLDRLDQNHDLGSGSFGRNIRSSPYFLMRAVEQLADRDLDLIMEIAGRGVYVNYEKWGRIRAISQVADRASTAQRQRFFDYVVKGTQAYDSRAEALRKLAPLMSLEQAERFILAPENLGWRDWILIESLASYLDDDVRQSLIGALRNTLRRKYTSGGAQRLTMLSAHSDSKEQQAIWDFIMTEASFIADLSQQAETIEMLLWHSTAQRRRWRAAIRRRARELVDRSNGSAYRPSTLRYLTFFERFRTTYRLLKDEVSGEVPSPLRRLGFSIWVAIAESITMRKVVRLVVLVGGFAHYQMKRLAPDWVKSDAPIDIPA